MTVSLQDKLVVAIASRALFDFEEENAVFEREGEQAYRALQLSRLDEPAREGVAFPLVQKLLAFNADGRHRVEVVVLSRNDPISGLRVFRSVNRAGLRVERGVFTQGRSPYRYLDALKAHLFLSTNLEDVRGALAAGHAAARVYPESAKAAERYPEEVRVAFDGDAVLFSDEAERVFQRDGLDAFQQHESEHARRPLLPGPFKPLLQGLHRLQSAAASLPVSIRTALVTARSAPAHERAIRTLMTWNVEIDEAMFLGGLSKGAFLAAFEPDFYFDDQTGHCESAMKAGPIGHVAGGVLNEAALPAAGTPDAPGPVRIAPPR